MGQQKCVLSTHRAERGDFLKVGGKKTPGQNVTGKAPVKKKKERQDRWGHSGTRGPHGKKNSTVGGGKIGNGGLWQRELSSGKKKSLDRIGCGEGWVYPLELS